MENREVIQRKVEKRYLKQCWKQKHCILVNRKTGVKPVKDNMSEDVGFQS